MLRGQGPGLCLHDIGETGGSETVTLLESEIPSHSHALMASKQPGEDRRPAGEIARPVRRRFALSDDDERACRPMSAKALAPAGGDQPHNNMMPYLTLNFCIALQGVYPPRT